MYKRYFAKDLPGVLLTLFLAGMFFVPAKACVVDAKDKKERELRRTQYLLTDLPLEQLFELDATTPARTSKSIADTAAAVYVVTQEDIRRSGAIDLVDVLRMVPGVEVLYHNTGSTSLTIRGFNAMQADKLLVLLDGRTLHTPFSSQAAWMVQAYPLAEIERIEVVRGPGGTLWGANAINGVINIITMPVEDTLGVRFTALGGNELHHDVGVRYGNQSTEDSCYRVYGRGLSKDDSPLVSGGEDAADDFRARQGGFRIDLEGVSAHRFSLQGDVFRGVLKEGWEVPSTTRSSADLLARWQRRYASGDWQLQAYYDHYRFDLVAYDYLADTFDLDFQHRLLEFRGHELLWGIGYRATHQRVENTVSDRGRIVDFEPRRRRDNLFSAFIQDDISLQDEEWILTLGTKVEHNDYTGWEWQPNVRLLWQPTATYSLWSAVSRAVRTPNYQNHNIRIEAPLGGGLILRGEGNPEFDSESVVAYEFGVRNQFAPNLSWDLAAFFNDYKNLFITETPPMFKDNGASIFPLRAANGMEGEVSGAELSLVWNGFWSTQKHWHVKLAYTYLNMDLQLKPGYQADFPEEGEGQAGKSPHNQISLRSGWDLAKGLNLDLWWRYVDELPTMGQDAYDTLDLRLGWQPLKNIELSLVGQGILKESHSEAGSALIITTPGSGTTALERAWYVKLDWRF